MMATGHFPVMIEEAVEALAVAEAHLVVDATFGGGGHTRAILDELPPGGRVVGVDRDPEAPKRASGLIRDRRFTFVEGAYDEALREMSERGECADAILFDLGLSSYQIDDPTRGFSYVEEGPLDMRMDPGKGPSASDFLNSAKPEEIAGVLSTYGDVPRGEARRVAREVVARRPLRITADLVGAVRGAVGWVERGGNPAKRVFQAVRMHVNDELGGLERALGWAEKLLSPGGRLAAITFHSGEDRTVKRFIAEREGRCVCPPDLPVCVCGARATLRRGKVLKPSSAEVAENPRSASARLRTAVRTSEPISETGDET